MNDVGATVDTTSDVENNDDKESQTELTKKSKDGPDSSKTDASKRKSDKEMKEFAFSSSIADLSAFQCSSKCQYGKICIADTTLRTIISERILFWGKADHPAPSASQRKEKIVDILKDAFLKNKQELIFAVVENGKKRFVCEFGLLAIIGLCGSKKEAPRQWTDSKRYLLKGELRIVTGYRRGCPKYDSAIVYIRYIVDRVSDTTGKK